MKRELDAACARAMGLTIRDTAWVQSHKVYEAPADTHWTDDAIAQLGGGAPIPSYSTDPAATRLLEDEIERRGILTLNAYVSALWDILGCTGTYEGPDIWADEWKLLRATPEQRARAFLAALDNAPAS